VSPERWLGLALRSESDFPHEWRYLAWAVRNRVEARGYPDTYAGVIRQARQFSYFNPTASLSDDDAYERALKGYAGDRVGWDQNDLEDAEACARIVMRAERFDAPVSHLTTHFWSPRSMTPSGRTPSWAAGMRTFTPAAIDPERWVFAEERR
jgi:hypothetical protein